METTINWKFIFMELIQERFDKYLESTRQDMKDMESETSKKGETSEDQDMMLIGIDIALTEAERIVRDALKFV